MHTHIFDIETYSKRTERYFVFNEKYVSSLKFNWTGWRRWNPFSECEIGFFFSGLTLIKSDVILLLSWRNSWYYRNVVPVFVFCPVDAEPCREQMGTLTLINWSETCWRLSCECPDRLKRSSDGSLKQSFN